jgi:hypothetical protein
VPRFPSRAGEDIEKMNPFHWRRDHQIGIGILIGGWLSWDQIRDCAVLYTPFAGHLDIFRFLMGCAAALYVKPILGGLIGAAVIYIRLLLRAPN